MTENVMVVPVHFFGVKNVQNLSVIDSARIAPQRKSIE